MDNKLSLAMAGINMITQHSCSMLDLEVERRHRARFMSGQRQRGRVVALPPSDTSVPSPVCPIEGVSPDP
jgi:hypothetical protein